MVVVLLCKRQNHVKTDSHSDSNGVKDKVNGDNYDEMIVSK